jgi:type IV pilus assembly protein PilB
VNIKQIFQPAIDQEIISEEDFNLAFAQASQELSTFFSIIIENENTDEEKLLKLLANSLNIPFEIIDRATIDSTISKCIPENIARQHSILPLFQIENLLTVAISNPFTLDVIENLEGYTNLTISPILAPKSSIEELFNFSYSYREIDSSEGEASMSSLFEMGMQLVGDKDQATDENYDLAHEAPIARLVDTVIHQAIADGASDIHIEPEETVVKIRFRIDGLLKEVMAPPKKLESAIISRLKILANLDITETRKPQDGRITIVVNEKDVDFRVSTVRTISGEKMVLRILDKSGAFVSIDKLGLNEKDFKSIHSLIQHTSGIVIVCGPTGSGKTSSLYSCLSKINTPDKNIVTIEDPVEFNLDGINQIPVNAKIGMDFVTGLSAVVRQDPDVIMIGEIRDFETAGIAIQAALTGHLVFTTIHTRSAAGSITRLIDMGVQPFLLTSSIVGVIGQRLVRKTCPNCKKEVESDQNVSQKYKDIIAEIKKVTGNTKIIKGMGCKFCENSGYKGRIGIFEIMTLSEELNTLIIEKASSARIRKKCEELGMQTMKDDGIHKIINGLTTIDEVARVLDV